MSDGNSDLAFLQYWGKAGRGDHENQYHLLAYHCLDVAAVGEMLLRRYTSLCQLFADKLGLDTTTFLAWHRFFLALHDLGKFSYRFQGLRKDLLKILQGIEIRDDYTWRHDSLGWLLWSEQLQITVLDSHLIGVEPSRPWRTAFDYWAKAVTGHHGQPPKNLKMESVRLQDQFSVSDIEAACLFATECVELLLPTRQPATLPDAKLFRDTMKPVSWWLAGVAVLCDWLGSGRDPTEFHAEAMPLEEYWHAYALPHADSVVDRNGVLPLDSTQCALKELFEYLKPPSPLQKTAAKLALSDEPSLFVIEEVTGSGKTEAALMLAHRLIANGCADSLYIGLPTMATSNAMFKRIETRGIHRKFFKQEPALLLAHSASRMQQPAPRQRALSDTSPESDYGDNEDSAATQRGAWFRDNRKKALLADLGVGTIDQALLAVLFSRHQSLRLLGLARKVLVVDEVHACDDYMQRLLEGVLKFHAAMGGSAILLTATLPRETRQRLVDAYCNGLNRTSPELTETAYPLLTRVTPTGKVETPVETRRDVARRVEVRLLHAASEAHALLLAAHEAGHCACWIRNTVGDALAAIQELREAGIPAEYLDLFHARFALGDRLGIEDRVLNHFGPDSRNTDRRARILVATQVVEQSLDLDFDLMISDLAPIDLLIQRAGRLCRHTRDPKGNLADKEQRGVPLLCVLGPNPVEEPEAEWYSKFFPDAAYVYKHHGQLWLTAQLLRKTGAIIMPEQARDLIEGVYGPDAEERIPEGLSENALAVAGDQSAERSIAAYNTVNLNEGYTSSGLDFWDDAVTPTRLGDPSVTVRLARWENGSLHPWYPDPRFPWELSQVNVRESVFRDEVAPSDTDIQLAVNDYRETVFDKGRWSKLLVLKRGEDGRWTGESLNRQGETVRLVYDERLGLRKLHQEPEKS